MRTMNDHKFKVGDRVVYRAVESGNTDLDGRCGTVVLVDSTAAPYTVRFDEPYVDAVRDMRCGGSTTERWHDWWCKEENLSPIGVRRKPVKKNARQAPKRGEDGMKRNHEWTESEDKLISEMLEQGESVVDITDRIGVDYVDMKNHLYALRKADPTFPRCMKRGRAGVINEEFDRAFEEDGQSKTDGIAGGSLNDLEAAMAEQIQELIEKVKLLERRNGELKDQNAELESQGAKLEGELKNYEAKFEKQDEYIHELEARVVELEARREDFNKEFEDGVSYYTAQLAISEDRVHSQIDHIAKLVEEKRKAEAELERTRRIVTELCAQFVVGGDPSTRAARALAQDDRVGGQG